MLQQNTSHQPTASLSQDFPRILTEATKFRNWPRFVGSISTPENPEGNKLHFKRQGVLALPEKGHNFKACLLNKI